MQFIALGYPPSENVHIYKKFLSDDSSKNFVT